MSRRARRIAPLARGISLVSIAARAKHSWDGTEALARRGGSTYGRFGPAEDGLARRLMWTLVFVTGLGRSFSEQCSSRP